jgi:ABC-type cobalamin/Fe3+-siderophores transport system ATPase subunit
MENFDLSISGQPSILLIGNNGSGKTTVGLALEILQKIGRGTNRVGDLAKERNFYQGRTNIPMRFEIEAELDGQVYEYVIAFELPEGFKESRVFEEKFAVDGKPIYTRELSQVRLAKMGREKEAEFRIDWHLVALPIIQEPSTKDPLHIFRQWLGHMLILRPMPSLIVGDSTQLTLEPNLDVTNLGAWFSRLVLDYPGAYSKIDGYLKQVMPNFKDIQNPPIGKDFRSLIVQFSTEQGKLSLPFLDLSDGEKCFMISAVVAAANFFYGPLMCFWDEPDNYLAPAEVGHFVIALRKAFQSGGQFIATSHNPEAILSFSDENTFVLLRKSHFEPTIARPLSEMHTGGNLVTALITGDLGS